MACQPFHVTWLGAAAVSRGTLEPWIAPLSAALDDGTVAPVIHAGVPFAQAPDAHRILAARDNVAT